MIKKYRPQVPTRQRATKTVLHSMAPRGRSGFYRLLTIAFCAAGFVFTAQSIHAQTTESFRATKSQLDQQVHQKLNRLIGDLRSDGKNQDAETVAKFLIPRDPQRQYIFFPAENEIDTPRFKELHDAANRSLSDIVEKHAAALYDLAIQESKSGNAAWAYQLLHEVLFFHPNHSEARRILGHKIIGEETKSWRVQPDRLRIKRATKAEKQFAWPAKTYWVASTYHFQIFSTASEAETRALATDLQRWKDAWRQIFFEFHNSQKNLRRWIAGTSKPIQSRRKFKVYFFKDQDQFVSALQDTTPGIAASTGYYNDIHRTAYFFADKDPTIPDTWKHEMTHQLFQETRSAKPGVFADGFLWLGEGIAMYMESLIDHGDYVTLGGFDARRLQYARLRRLKEQFRVPLDELSTLGLAEFQSLPDIAKVYSQSAGVTQYLMTGDNGEHQSKLVEFLKIAYARKLKRNQFETLIEKSFSQIESRYEEFLKVDVSDLEFLDRNGRQRELSLIGTKLKPESLDPVATISEFDWLDLSACDVRESTLKPLESCRSIQQLFLTGAIVDKASLQILSQLPIKELDLSGTNLQDSWLDMLTQSKSLQSLNIAGTQVTDRGRQSFATSRPKIRIAHR